MANIATKERPAQAQVTEVTPGQDKSVQMNPFQEWISTHLREPFIGILVALLVGCAGMAFIFLLMTIF
ncbi:MAG: hypothetical protein V1894_00345 [Chloroflexota bacterium]